VGWRRRWGDRWFKDLGLKVDGDDHSEERERNRIRKEVPGLIARKAQKAKGAAFSGRFRGEE